MIRTNRAHLHVAALSHAGQSGKNNEDNFGVSAFKAGSDSSLPVLLAVVADGIGGHMAGEVASEMAVNIISAAAAQGETSEPHAIFTTGIQQANLAIHTLSEESSEHYGMGTTCACALIIASQLYIAWVGDSRIYLLRGGKIFQLTSDHSWVQEAIEKGILKAEDAHAHPNRHVIRRYLGGAETPQPGFHLRLGEEESAQNGQRQQGGLALQAGDKILLCTDGLTDLVEDGEILSLLGNSSIKASARELVDLANARGGLDNITVVLLAVPQNGIFAG